MNRDDALAYAGDLISGARAESYGPWKDNAACLAGLWSAYLGHTITPFQATTMMALLKIMRLRPGTRISDDSIVDAIGYLALGGELDSENAIKRDADDREKPI